MAVLYTGSGHAAPATVLDATVSAEQVVMKKPTRSIEQRLTRIENILQARTRAQLETQQRLDQLSIELMNLQGAIEESNLEQVKITQRQRNILNDIERIRTTLVAKPITPVITEPAILGSTEQPANLTGKDSYNYAIKLIKNERKYDEAIPALQSFISTYPESELAPNAHYWLGLLLRKDNKNAEAKVEFEKIVTKFPASNKRADSLQKLGQLAKLSGAKGEAKRYFELVIKDYPNDAVAKLAKQELAALK